MPGCINFTIVRLQSSTLVSVFSATGTRLCLCCGFQEEILGRVTGRICQGYLYLVLEAMVYLKFSSNKNVIIKIFCRGFFSVKLSCCQFSLVWTGGWQRGVLAEPASACYTILVTSSVLVPEALSLCTTQGGTGWPRTVAFSSWTVWGLLHICVVSCALQTHANDWTGVAAYLILLTVTEDFLKLCANLC